MTEMAAILRHATRRSLLILDEVGRGTSTQDGLAIARAILEDVHDRLGARTLFATHFHELAAVAAELPRLGVFHTAVAEEHGRVIFLRRVEPGATNRSYGVHVARLAGLPAAVTERAEAILDQLERTRVVLGGAGAEPVLRQPLDQSVPGQCHPELAKDPQLGAVSLEADGSFVVPPQDDSAPLKGRERSQLKGRERSQRDAAGGNPPEGRRTGPDGLAAALLQIDLATTTPLDALNHLARLQHRARSTQQP
jgi:DNA mismatch repair protein MutS